MVGEAEADEVVDFGLVDEVDGISGEDLQDRGLVEVYRKIVPGEDFLTVDEIISDIAIFVPDSPLTISNHDKVCFSGVGQIISVGHELSADRSAAHNIGLACVPLLSNSHDAPDIIGVSSVALLLWGGDSVVKDGDALKNAPFCAWLVSCI